jgi:hypothetical protein
MKTPSLRAVGARLEKASALLPGEPSDSADSTNPSEAFDRYESVAIAILDSEHSDFSPGVLQEYLKILLYKRRLELDLIPDPQEV